MPFVTNICNEVNLNQIATTHYTMSWCVNFFLEICQLFAVLFKSKITFFKSAGIKWTKETTREGYKNSNLFSCKKDTVVPWNYISADTCYFQGYFSWIWIKLTILSKIALIHYSWLLRAVIICRMESIEPFCSPINWTNTTYCTIYVYGHLTNVKIFRLHLILNSKILTKGPKGQQGHVFIGRFAFHFIESVEFLTLFGCNSTPVI